uniref:Uncharacterized protein n=1 Tax=Arundo donax TaxID=35708 RepID=A0A0A9DBB9_ARUDO
MDCGLPILPTSFGNQNAVLDKPGNNEDVLDHFVQDGCGHSVDLKSIDKHAEFVQDAMEVDGTESCRLKLLVADNVPSTSDTSIKLACSVLPQGMELSGTNLEDKGPDESSEILDGAKSYTKYLTDSATIEREKTTLDLEIPSGSNVCSKDKDVDQSNDIPVDTEAYRGTSEPVECPPGGTNDEEPIEKIMDENIEQTMVGEVESIDIKTRKNISVEPVFHGQEIISTGYIYDERSANASCESDELKDKNSEETFASLEKNIAKTHEQLLNCSYPSGKVEIPTTKSEKQTD